MKDNVNHPTHYCQGGVECIDALKAATVNKKGIEAVCVANVIKYLFRYETKNGLEDVKKAQWYLSRLIQELEQSSQNTNKVETPTIPYDEQDCDECYYSDRPVSQEPCSRCKHNMIYGTDEYETATSLWKEKPYVANKPH